MKEITIGKADPTEALILEDLTRLASASSNSNSQVSTSGYLFGVTTAKKFQNYINNGIVRVARENGTVIGFVVAYSRDSVLFKDLWPILERVEWHDPAILQLQKLIYVDKKTVHPEHRRKGVATALYEHLFKEFPDYCFLGATVEKPTLNKPSQEFRFRHNFRRVGTFKADEFEGFKDYQSALYAKNS